MKEVYKFLAESVESDHIVYLHVTSPLLETNTLRKSLEIYKNLDEEYSSLASVEHIMRYLWFNENL